MTIKISKIYILKLAELLKNYFKLLVFALAASNFARS
jgi:hypothetical protein